MKVLIKTILVLIGCLSLATLAPAVAQPTKVAPGDASVADTIKKLEQDWVDAMIAGDIAKLSPIFTDDWIEGYPGKNFTKETFLADVKSGKHKLVACDFGPREVKVFGDVAVLQGSVMETRVMDGQNTKFGVAYMDVWVKRGGRWLVSRSFAKRL